MADCHLTPASIWDFYNVTFPIKQLPCWNLGNNQGCVGVIIRFDNSRISHNAVLSQHNIQPGLGRLTNVVVD